MATGFRVDQPTGAGAGANKKARADLWVGTECEVHDTGAGGTPTWALSVPIGSAAALVAGSPITFVPDVPGTYRLSQTRDGMTLNRVFRVTKDNAGVAIAGLLVLPAFREEEGDSDGITGQGSTAGMLPLHVAIRDAVVATRTAMSDSGATLAYGINRRTSGAAFAMPALSGSSSGVLAVVFINLTGVDVTLTAAGTDRFETGVSSPTYVVIAARRSVTFLDDGTIWEPSAAP